MRRAAEVTRDIEGGIQSVMVVGSAALNATFGQLVRYTGVGVIKFSHRNRYLPSFVVLALVRLVRYFRHNRYVRHVVESPCSNSLSNP